MFNRHLLWLSWPALLALGAPVASAQDTQRGREIALLVCTSCHLVEPDQQYTIILRPPAPTFASIAQRPTTTTESIRMHLKTTHRGANNPNGMPNPQLTDSYIELVTSYLLSLRNNHQ